MIKFFSALLGLALLLPASLHAQEAKPTTSESAPASTSAAAPQTAPAAEPEKQGGEPKPAAKKRAKTNEPLQLVKTPEPLKPVSRSEALKRANAFFNASPVMTADFVQIGADGKRSEGKLHVPRESTLHTDLGSC